MSRESKTIGKVENESQIQKDVPVPAALLVLGGAAVGAYIGFKIGGPLGATVGVLVGTFVGGFAAGFIKSFKVLVHADGAVEVRYETRFT